MTVMADKILYDIINKNRNRRRLFPGLHDLAQHGRSAVYVNVLVPA